MKDLPEYTRLDDIYWEVRRQFCNVSNWTYGPIEDWDEDKIRGSVDQLREAITEMLEYNLKRRKSRENDEKAGKQRLEDPKRERFV